MKSGLATAGLVLGIVGVVFSAVPIVNNIAFVLGLLALVFGIIWLVKAKGVDVKRAKAIAAVVLGVATIIIVIVSQYAYGQVLNKVSDSINKSTGDQTAEILKSDADVVLGQFAATQDQYVTNTELPVTVTNKTNEKKSFTIHIEAVDASGSRITDDTVYANDLTAGQKQDFKAFTLVTSDKVDALKSAKFNIVTVTEF